MGFFVLIVLAPALRESLGLFLLRKSCDEVGVTGRDALCLERFGYFGDELQQSKAGVDVAVAFACLLGKRGNVIAGKVEKPLITLRLLVRMHVNTLTVLDLSLVLQKLSMTSTTMESCTLWNCYL